MEEKFKNDELGKIVFFSNAGKLLFCTLGAMICSFFVRLFLYGLNIDEAIHSIPFSFAYNLIFWAVCISVFKFLGGWTRKKDFLNE